MYYLFQAGTSLQAMETDGTITTLTLPSGVVIDQTKRGQFAVVANQVLFSYASSVNLWIDPETLIVRPMSILPPIEAPTLAAGSGTGLTGVYRYKISFAVKDDTGTIIQESPLSGPSLSVTVTNTDIALTDLAVSDSSFVNCRRLYRTVAGGSVYFNVLDIDDNVTTAINDNIPDAALDVLPSDPALGNPPGAIGGTGLELLIAWKNRLWGKPSTPDDRATIRYSEDGQFYAWPEDNNLPAYPKGEDEFGVTAFMPRRDELGIGKRARIIKIVGQDFDPVNGDVQVITVAEGIGVIAPASVVVIRDVAYFLGLDGVYTFGPDGVQPISRDKVDPWFLTDTYFNRALFADAVGQYNPKNDTYDLHLAAAGSSNLDRWISLDVRRKEWLGPSLTNKFTYTFGTLLRDAGGAPLPFLGSSAGFVYAMNDPTPSDDGTAIPIVWTTKFFAGGDPDMFHFWGQTTFHNKNEGPTAGTTTFTVTPKVGDLNASAGTTQNISLRKDRNRLARFGTGRFLSLTFNHSTDAEDVSLYGFEIPFHEIGRR